jgi:hypothetical protein
MRTFFTQFDKHSCSKTYKNKYLAEDCLKNVIVLKCKMEIISSQLDNCIYESQIHQSSTETIIKTIHVYSFTLRVQDIYFLRILNIISLWAHP